MQESQGVPEQTLGDFNPLKVQTIDPKTKRVVEKKPFTVYCVKGSRYYEYPVGSGNLWYEDRSFCGRKGERSAKGEFDIQVGEAHVKWEPPATADQTVAVEAASLKVENAKLLAELADIKKEQQAASVTKQVVAAKQAAIFKGDAK